MTRRFVNVTATVEIIVEIPVDAEPSVSAEEFLQGITDAATCGRWIHAVNPKVIHDCTEDC